MNLDTVTELVHDVFGKSPPVRYLRRGMIADHRRTSQPRPRLTADGYTSREGSPTGLEIRIQGCKRWRRVYVWQFSNAGTAFVRVGGRPAIVREADLPC